MDIPGLIRLHHAVKATLSASHEHPQSGSHSARRILHSLRISLLAYQSPTTTTKRNENNEKNVFQFLSVHELKAFSREPEKALLYRKRNSVSESEKM